MIRYSVLNYTRYLFLSSSYSRHLSHHRSIILKDFDRRIFDYFYLRRLEIFNGNKEKMFDHIRTHIESILKTRSIIDYLTNLNSKHQYQLFSQTITIEQLNDILFYAYEHNIKLDLLTKRLIECVSFVNKHFHSSVFIELINLFVLHQQKYYDIETKSPNQTIEKFIHYFECNLTQDEIKCISLASLSLLCSSMYRLQISLKNQDLLEYIGQYLIDDEIKKTISAVDKQNFIKILTLSNYGKINIAQALANRFNQSFEQNMKLNLNSFSYEIVRMTMRIGIYFFMFHYYSREFFDYCLKLIEFESNSSRPWYRTKDIIQTMNTLIYMGHVKKPNFIYLNLIDTYYQMNQFNQKPERLLNVLAPLAMIDSFPENLLEELFTKNNLNRLTGN